MIIRRRGDERGSVVAEFAVALPAVALVLLLGVSALAAGARQVRLQDAAADAARLVARGETAGRAGAVVSAAVPGSSIEVEPRGDLICITASATDGLFAFAVAARSCALSGGL
jgi:Flp pilus assembly protein TadG